MSETRCNLCGKYALLVKSHVIPKSFFEIDGCDIPRLYTNVPGQHTKKAPAGVYDRIVCDACERSFDEYDSYAAHVLLQKLNSYERITSGGKFAGLSIPNIDYRRLKLFSIAV